MAPELGVTSASGPPRRLRGRPRRCPQAAVTRAVFPQATIMVFQALAQYQVSMPRQLKLNLDVSVLLPRRANAITYRIENSNALVARSAEVPAPSAPCSAPQHPVPSMSRCPSVARDAASPPHPSRSMSLSPSNVPVPTDQAERGLHGESFGHGQGDDDGGDRLQRQGPREGEQV